jgi:hypothetical protein
MIEKTMMELEGMEEDIDLSMLDEADLEML